MLEATGLGAAVRRRVVETARLQMAVTEAGSDNAPPLVLLHGIGSRAESWWPVLDDLAERYRIYAPDLRGHGASGKPATGYLLPEYAADLAALLDALQLARPLVLGHSLGALAALTWAAAAPGRAAAIALEDPPLRTEPEVLGAFDGWIALSNLPPVEAAAWYRHEHPHWTDEECRRRAESITSVAPAVFAELRADSARALAEGHPERIATLATIDAPLLIVRGEPELGGMTRHEDAARLLATVPRARVVDIPGVGHNVHRDQPAAFLAAVLGFFAEVEESAT